MSVLTHVINQVQHTILWIKHTSGCINHTILQDKCKEQPEWYTYCYGEQPQHQNHNHGLNVANRWPFSSIQTCIRSPDNAKSPLWHRARCHLAPAPMRCQQLVQWWCQQVGSSPWITWLTGPDYGRNPEVGYVYVYIYIYIYMIYDIWYDIWYMIYV